MKKIKLGLLPKIIIAILLGTLLGGVLPEWCSRIFITFNGLFSQLLGFVVPLIIVGLVTPAIAEIGQGAKKMLIATTLLAYSTTLIAGLLSYFTGVLTFPSLIDSQLAVDSAAQAVKMTPYFSIDIPPLMGVMTALITSFVFGLGIAYLQGDV